MFMACLRYNPAMNKDSKRQDPVYKTAKKLVDRNLAVMDGPAALTPEQVHEVRVCTKKLRALIQMYRPHCGKNAIKAVEKKTKRIADQYSGARDAQVMHQTLVQLAEMYCAEQGEDVAPLLAHYADANAKIQQVSPHSEFDLQQAFSKLMDSWQKQIRPKANTDFALGLEFSYQQARKLAFEAETLDQDECYHHCRKWVKYYLYQINLFVNKNDPIDELVDSLKALAELLGLFHDRCVLEASLNGLLQSQPSPNLALESACLLMLSWLVEQKRLDKANCQNFFEQLFSHSNSPVPKDRINL